MGAGLAATDRLLVHVLRLPLAPRPCRDLLPALEKRQEVLNIRDSFAWGRDT